MRGREKEIEKERKNTDMIGMRRERNRKCER